MFLTKEWIEEAFPDDHVLTTHRKDDMLSDTRIKSVILDSRQLLDRLYTTYDFDRIVYFSEYLLPHNNPEGELDRLRRVLQEFREKEVELIYFSGPESVLTPPTSQSILTRTAEELCLHYAKTSKIQVKVFRLPYIYSISAAGPKCFERLFQQIPTEKVSFDEQAAQPVYALCFDELASLVNRVFDTWTPQPELFTLPEVFHIYAPDVSCRRQGGTQPIWVVSTLLSAGRPATDLSCMAEKPNAEKAAAPPDSRYSAQSDPAAALSRDLVGIGGHGTSGTAYPHRRAIPDG